MKKLAWLVALCAVLALLCGCAAKPDVPQTEDELAATAEQGPRDAVAALLSAFRTGDFEAATAATENGTYQANFEGLSEEQAALMTTLLGKIAYEVTGTEMPDENTADVTVLMLVPDTEKLSEKATEVLLERAADGMSAEEIDALTTQIIRETLSEEPMPTVSKTLTVHCVKTEDGWKTLPLTPEELKELFAAALPGTAAAAGEVPVEG